MIIRVFKTEVELNKDFISESESEIRSQINEYLKSERKVFNLSVSFPNSFTGQVMSEMSEISYGETSTYGDISKELNSAAIAVGQACGRNPVPIIVPCHRVIGKNSLGGYSLGLELKRKLLDLESADF